MDKWEQVEEFGNICAGIGSLGFGSKWNGKVEEFLNVVSLDELLTVLQTVSENGEWTKIDLVCVVLKEILQSNVGNKELTKKEFIPSLIQGLGHYSEKVRGIAARQIKFIGIESFDNNESLIESLIHSLYDEDTSVAENANDALAKYCLVNRTIVLKHIQNVEYKSIQLPQKAEESVAQLRIFHLVARIAASDEQGLIECEKAGVLAPLLGLIEGDDVLLQMNILKLFPLIGATNAGLEMLLEKTVITNLKRMAGIDDNTIDPFLGDEALRVLAQLSARILPQTDELALSFLRAIEQRLQILPTQDPSLSLTTMKMLGSFAGAQPPLSLKLILKNKPIVEKWMEFATSYGDAHKATGIESIATALRGGAIYSSSSVHEHKSADHAEYEALLEQSQVKVDELDQQEAAKYGTNLFTFFGSALNKRIKKYENREKINASETVTLLMDLTKLPLDDQRCASYSLLRAIAAQDDTWGITAIYFAGNQVEKLLLDRSLEMSKPAKEWRFSVLETIYHNPHRDIVLGPQRLQILETFLKRGPYLGPKAAPVPQIELSGK